MKLTLGLLIYAYTINMASATLTFRMKNDKVFKFDKFLQLCDDTNNATNAMQLIYIKFPTPNTFNYKLRLTKKIREVAVQIQFWRCHNRENLDSCMSLSAFKMGRACAFVEKQNEFWTPIVQTTTPRPTCPMEKGYLVGENSTINMDGFALFPLGQAYWKAKVHLYLKKQEIFCAIAEGSLVR